MFLVKHPYRFHVVLIANAETSHSKNGLSDSVENPNVQNCAVFAWILL